MSEENPDEEVQELLRALQSGKPITGIKLGDGEVAKMDGDKVFDPKEVTLHCVVRSEIDRARFSYGTRVFNVTMKVSRDLTAMDITDRDKLVLNEAAKHGVGTLQGIPLCHEPRNMLAGIVGYSYCDTMKMAVVRRSFPHPIMRR